MKSPITTITGIVLGLLSVATAIGLINAEQTNEIQKWLPTFVEGVSALILVFKAKD